MLTVLRIYTVAGLICFPLFGGLSVWAEKRHMRRLDSAADWVAVAAFPAILIAGALIAAGSIRL